MRIPDSPAAVCSKNARRIFATDNRVIGKADGRSESEDLQDHVSVFVRLVLSRKGTWRILGLFICCRVNKTRRTAIIGLLALCIWTSARAEERDSVQVSVQAIEEVEIQASRLSREVVATAPAQVMRSETMKALAIQNVADAVRHFTGTTVKDYGGIGGLKTVSVRGLGATHTAVSYDGVVMGNCQAGQIDLGRFSSNGLGSISLHVGQNDDMTSTARALASGSVVGMNSMAPQWNGKQYHIEAGIMGGSFGLYNPSVVYAQKLGQRTWTNVGADFSSAHGRYPYTLVNGTKVSTDRRANTDIKQLSCEWNLHHEFEDGSSIDSKAYYYDSERGLPGAVILYNNSSAERLADRNAFAQVRYSKQWSHQWQLRTVAKYTYGWNRYTDTNVKYAEGKQIDENLQREYYGSATLLYRPATAWTFSLAQDALVNTLKSNLPSCPFPVRYTSLTALQAEYRTEWFRLRGILLGTIADEETDASRNGGLSELTQEFTPTFSLSVRPFSSTPLYVRLMYKETFRMPTFNDLYYFRSGNKNLRPERAHEYNAGITWQAPQMGIVEELTFTADGYFNDVTDKIVAFPTTYVWKMANYGRVHITGLDATLTSLYRLSSKAALNVGASYTLQRAIDVTDPQAQGYRVQLPYTPLHSGSVRLLLSTPWVGVGYSMIASSERYSMSEHSARYRIAPYAEHTITLSRSFVLYDTDLTVQAEAINFTNAQYEVIQYYPMPGRQFRLSLNIKL